MRLNLTLKQGTSQPLDAQNVRHLYEELCDWIAAYLAEHKEVDRSLIDPAERFQRLGLDSMGATTMLVELWLLLLRRSWRGLADPVPWAMAAVFAAYGAVVLLLMRARLVAAGRSAAERWSGWD